MSRRPARRRTGRWAAAALACAALLAAGTPALAQAADEPDPCASAVGNSDVAGCWAREVERADARMGAALVSALAKLEPHGAGGGLRRAQKAWLEFREAQLDLLQAVLNPGRVHRWADTICLAIARRQLTLERARALERLADPTGDGSCPQ